ncbi:MAG: hypothetical protein D6766_05765, partial [Verrucomicrobia bacterium]
PWSDRLELSVPPGDCRVLAIRPAVDHPQVLSTSRHVTQGVVDLRWEHWDAAEGILSGESDLVGGDPYELRIVLPESPSLKPGTVELVRAPEQVTAVLDQQGRLVRVRLTSPGNLRLRWRVKFAPAN